MFFVTRNTQYYDIILVTSDIDYFADWNIYHNFSTQKGKLSLASCRVKDLYEVAVTITRFELLSDVLVIFYFQEDIYKMTAKEFIKTQQELNPEKFL